MTPKQEKFCQAIVSGSTQADSYRMAYDARNMKPETVQNKAYLLMRKDDIRTRIEELRKPVVEKLQYDLEQAMSEAAEAFVVAKGKENGGAMVAAVQLRAKLNGLLIERREVRNGSLDDIPYEEKVESLKAVREAIRKAREIA